ncbi:MAG: hypothetical protein ACREOH_23950 [Candidatus Entotheonellia bacterium]
MEYQLQQYNHPDLMDLHVPKRLIRSPLFHAVSADPRRLPAWVKALLEIEGIQDVSVQPYRLTLYKGRLFGWEAILLEVGRVLEHEFETEAGLDASLQDLWKDRDTGRGG